MRHNNNLKEIMIEYNLTNALVAKLMECNPDAVVAMKCGNQRFNNRDETHLLLKLKAYYEKNLVSLSNDLSNIIEK